MCLQGIWVRRGKTFTLGSFPSGSRASPQGTNSLHVTAEHLWVLGSSSGVPCCGVKAASEDWGKLVEACVDWLSSSHDGNRTPGQEDSRWCLEVFNPPFRRVTGRAEGRWTRPRTPQSLTGCEVVKTLLSISDPGMQSPISFSSIFSNKMERRIQHAWFTSIWNCLCPQTGILSPSDQLECTELTQAYDTDKEKNVFPVSSIQYK